MAKNPDGRPQSVGEIAKRLEVPPPKTRRALGAAKQSNKKRVGLIIAVAFLIVAAAITAWYFGFYQNFGKTRNVVTAQPSVTEPKPEPTISVPIETPVLPTAAPMAAASAQEKPNVPAGPKISANAVYEGTIHVKNDNSTNVPLAITIGSTR